MFSRRSPNLKSHTNLPSHLLIETLYLCVLYFLVTGVLTLRIIKKVCFDLILMNILMHLATSAGWSMSQVRGEPQFSECEAN